jgi:lipopolysaccharide export system permease protein
MMSIIDRSLFREVLAALGMIVAVISVILVANTLVRILGKVAAGGLDQGVVFVLVGLELAKILGFMIPPAFFFALLLVLGRMYRDSEMVALEAAGVGPARALRAVALVAFPLAILVTWLVMQVLPWAKGYTELIKQEQSKTGDFTALRSGRFNEFQSGDLVVFFDRVDDEARLSRVFVQHRQHGKIGLVVAAQAQLRRDLFADQDFIVLNDGKRYEGQPGNGDFVVGAFEQYGLRMSLEGRMRQRRGPPSARSWQALLTSQDLEDRAELQYRLAFPLAVFALVLVALPLVRLRPRQGLYGRLALAVLIYFIFMNLLRVGQEWMEEGVTAPWVGVWWVPAIFAALALVILCFDSLGFRALLRRRRAIAR